MPRSEIAVGIEEVAKHLRAMGESLQRIARLLQEADDVAKKAQRSDKDQVLDDSEVAKALGYSKKSLQGLRSQNSPLIRDLTFFKLCECETSRRLTQSKCNHPAYAMASDVAAFLKRRKEEYARGKK